MANKPIATGSEKPEPIATPGPDPIEQLRAKHKINRAVFAGVCSAKGWRPGRAVSEEEFLAAVKEFNAAPMSGPRKHKESEAKK